MMPLKFRNGEGKPITFLTSITSITLGSQKYFLFQLFPPPGSTGWKAAAFGSVSLTARRSSGIVCTGCPAVRTRKESSGLEL
jgi:hypothetical protein